MVFSNQIRARFSLTPPHLARGFSVLKRKKMHHWDTLSMLNLHPQIRYRSKHKTPSSFFKGTLINCPDVDRNSTWIWRWKGRKDFPLPPLKINSATHIQRHSCSTASQRQPGEDWIRLIRYGSEIWWMFYYTSTDDVDVIFSFPEKLFSCHPRGKRAKRKRL